MKRKATKFLIIHCSATRPSMIASAAEINRWHKARGWKKIGYHFVLRRDGKLETGRAIDEIGAHAVGPAPAGAEGKNWWNENAVSICWEGGVNEDTLQPEDNRTPEQIVGLIAFIKFIKSLYDNIEVIGHRDVPDVKKACPCFDVKAFVKEHSL